MASSATEARPPVAQLLDDAMREQQLSLRKFSQLAVDPRSGYRMSHHLAKSVRAGNYFRITPEVIRAIAAGTGRSVAVVQLAAAAQFLGFDQGTA